MGFICNIYKNVCSPIGYEQVQKDVFTGDGFFPGSQRKAS